MTNTAPIRLIPLVCPRCATAVPANPDEVAWVCEQCGQGMLLDEADGSHPLNFFFSSAVQTGQKGRPFWVAPGKVTFTRRETYKGNESRDAQTFWAAPRLFFTAAWNAGLEEVISMGVHLLKTPDRMTPGSPVPFLPVTTLPADMQALAEFMVLSIEAERRDALRKVEFHLKLDPPQLWVLP